MRSHTHSPARFTSPACDESALTLGMLKNSESSSSQAWSTAVRYFFVATQAQALTGRTAWARNLALPVRDYLRTESGGAVVLLAGAIVAIAWANVGTSYETFWAKELSIHVGGAGISDTLRGWINDGLMVFFFLVAGL
jgi:Na+/H+ antiporter 1